MKQILCVLMVIAATSLSGCPGNGAQQIFETAELEELQDNHEHAKKLYQEIIDKYPGNDVALKAEERLAALQKTK